MARVTAGPAQRARKKKVLKRTKGHYSLRHKAIRTAKESLAYLVMLAETLGDDWMTPDLFRFGASTLANDVLMQIAKLADGRYQGADYFSLP